MRSFLDNNRVYNAVMVCVIIISLVPLLSHETSHALRIVELSTAAIFIIDYILRWVSAGSLRDALRYPITPFAIIDLLSILPALLMFAPALKLFRLLRLVRALRVFRAFRLFRYSKNVEMIAAVFRKQKNALVAVGMLAVGYILISALVMFQIEPKTFDTFFDAVYWATVSLTTVGYGDIYASSLAGRVITMVSAFMGIAIVALPAGIITAGYMEELNKK